jgi:O-antigen ligase
MKIYQDFKINNFFVIKLLFYSFPIILLFPSGYITAHVSLLTLASLILIYKHNLKIKLLFIDYLIFSLFFLSIFSTFKNIAILGNIIFIKSILDVRFAIFFLIIRNILNNKIVNLQFLSKISLISSIVLSLDIFLQHLIGHDILGFKPFEMRYNGFFEHEAIAGAYIQKFFLLSILSILILHIKKITKIIFVTFSINILGLGTLLSLDRMPFIILIIIVFVLFVFMKNFRILFFSNLMILIILFACLIKNYEIVKIRYKYFDQDINFSKILDLPIIKNNINTSLDKDGTLPQNNKLFYGDYSKLYHAAYLVFSKNYFIGSGVKSFIYECTQLSSNIENISCNNHPHNLYLEILVNLGIVGMSIFIIFLFFLINKIIKNLLKNNINTNQKVILIIFLTIFIAELIPIRSYGSIFQTNNGSIFWFFLGLISYINNFSIKKIKNVI